MLETRLRRTLHGQGSSCIMPQTLPSMLPPGLTKFWGLASMSWLANIESRLTPHPGKTPQDLDYGVIVVKPAP